MLKTTLKRIPGVRPLVRTIRHLRGDNEPKIAKLIRKHLRDCPRPFIVQVGSNDGQSGDPIYNLFRQNPGWRGLFVEPVPYLMERLQQNYAFAKDCLFECAVINDGSPATFYYFDAQMRKDLPDLPDWWEQLGSLNADHAVGLPGFDRVEKYRRAVPITGITLPQLFKKHGVNHVDLFHVDAEGYDWLVLSQLDLSKVRPKIIMYEKKCLPYEHRIAAYERLIPLYDMFTVDDDMFCLLRDRPV
jgi:FkbM family methyltransferase